MGTQELVWGQNLGLEFLAPEFSSWGRCRRGNDHCRLLLWRTSLDARDIMSQFEYTNGRWGGGGCMYWHVFVALRVSLSASARATGNSSFWCLAILATSQTKVVSSCRPFVCSTIIGHFFVFLRKMYITVRLLYWLSWFFSFPVLCVDSVTK